MGQGGILRAKQAAMLLSAFVHHSKELEKNEVTHLHNPVQIFLSIVCLV
jgi:hypothetical protein